GITLPGGEVQFGLGGQYRRDKYSIVYGDNSNLAFNPCRESPVTGTLAPCRPNQGSTANPPATGALGFLGTNRNARAAGDVYAAFGELQLPIFDALNVQLGLRYEDYGGGVGSTLNPQARARFQATDWLAFRGGVGTTFRGPRNENLNDGSITSLQLLGTTFKPIDINGNPNLSPESATNYSGGVLLKFGGFNASVDYYRFDIKDAILSEPVSGIVNTLFTGTNCANPAFAALRRRFQFADGGGVPGAGTCTLANVSRLRTQIVNGASIRNSGIDFAANYRGNFGGDGRFGAGVNATYTIEYKTAEQVVEGVVISPAFDAAGKLNFQTTAYPVPEWKGQAFVDVGSGPIDARFQVNYIDDYYDQRADIRTSGLFGPLAELGGASLLSGARIKKFVTADFNLRVSLPWDVTGSLTVNNIFDKAPPFARLDYNYDPFTGSALLRTVKVGLSTKF
ncbi:MAG TPA: TonB-dependent receptor, partial [Sphingomicrobium sp.]